MAGVLTRGAIEIAMNGGDCNKPVLQILGLKKLQGNSGTQDRYRLLLSDGLHSHSSCMLATQLNEKVSSGELEQFAVIRLDKFICNPIQPDRRVMILLEVTLISSAAAVGGIKLGDPTPLRVTGSGNPNTGSDSSTAAAATSMPAANQRPAPMSLSNGFAASNQNTGRNFYSEKQNQPSSKPFGQSGNAPKNSAGFGNSNDTPMKVFPIASLTPYQNRWTIKVRVTQKSNIKTWSNSRGEGSLFSMNLLDDSGEIRATAFKNEVEKFYNLIEVNKVYYIRKATLKAANKQFSTVQNDYEMTFNNDTEVIPCEDDTSDLPAVTFTFVPIADIEKHPANNMIDVIGVVKEIQDIKTVVTKLNQKELKKRDIVLVDESKVQINLTVWGADAENFEATNQQILAIKGARVSEWNGRSLSAVSSSQIILNPDIAECHRLRGWFDSIGNNLDFSEYKREGGTGTGGTPWKLLSEVKAQNLSQDQADYFCAKVDIAHMKKDNCLYKACPTPECNKKVVDQSDGFYRCEKCSKNFPDFKWRMLLQLNVVDFTGDLWVTCFQDTAEFLLNRKAEEIGYLKDNNVEEFDQLFAANHYRSVVLKCRSKMETFNDETRLKTICMQASPVNYKEYNQRLIADLESLLQTL